MGSLTNKQKFIALLVGALLFLWIAYLFSFSQTIEMWSMGRETATKMKQVSTASGRMLAVKKQHKALDAIIDRNLATGNDFREKLLLTVTQACNQHGVRFQEMHEAHFFSKETFTVETHTMQISGRYHKLMALLYDLERSKNIGSIKSVHFFLKREYRNDRKNLVMELYVQAIRKQKK